MADYNSPYTGAEVDAAILKTDQIVGSVQVYSGAATSAGILISSIPENPGTGDRLGTYDIVFTRSTTPLASTVDNVFVSRLVVANLGASAIGTSHINVNADRTNSQNASYWTSAEGSFHAGQDTYYFADDSTEQTPWYIHEIYRLQQI